jgi:cytoskeleton protein RodZ
MRGVSLDDIAEATKIGTRLLRALEEEHFELLPGGIFNKGFVRAYAKYLGLNEEEAVADYLQAAGESSPDPRLIAEQNSSRIDRASGRDAGGSRMAGFPLIPVLILLVVVAAGWGGWRMYQERLSQRQARISQPTEATSSTRAASPAPVEKTSSLPSPVSGGPEAGSAGTASPPNDTTNNRGAADAGTLGRNPPGNNASVGSAPGQVASTKPPAATRDSTSILTLDSTNMISSKPPTAESGATTAVPSGQPFEIAVHAKDRAWVSIKSDGKYVVRGIISPDDVKTIRATDQVIFWTGNAGAVEVSFNGQRISLAGGPNTEGMLVFNSRGVVIPKPATPTPEP